MAHDHSHQHDTRGHDASGHETGGSSFWTSRCFLAFLGFAAIALFFLWSEHKAHILGALPFLILLACPLLHFFGHGSHGGHGGTGSGGGKT